MSSLTNEVLSQYRQKRKESYLKGDLHNYIKYSAIIMPEELGITVKQSAEFFKYSPSSIYRLRSSPFIREGGPCGGRRNSLMSIDEELSFITIFKNESSQGRSPSFKEMKARIENKIGKTIHKTSVYRLLERHGCKNLSKKNKLLS
jgi:transposase